MQKAITENHSGITSFEKLLRVLVVNYLKKISTAMLILHPGHEYANEILENTGIF